MVDRRRQQLFTAAGVILALCLLAAGPAAVAKKKKPKPSVVTASQTVNAAIPDGTATTNGLLTQTMNLGGKKLKGAEIRDVNVTLQTTGSGANAATQISASLTAPNGATTWPIGIGLGNGPNGLGGQSIGPLTLDDESSMRLVPTALGVQTSNALPPPYAGTAQPNCFFASGSCTLSVLDGGPVRGAWTLRAYDVSNAGGLTSVLNAWSVNVRYGKAYRTK